MNDKRKPGAGMVQPDYLDELAAAGELYAAPKPPRDRAAVLARRAVLNQRAEQRRRAANRRARRNGDA